MNEGLKLNYEGAFGVEKPEETATRIYDEVCKEYYDTDEKVRQIGQKRIDQIKENVGEDFDPGGLARLVAKSGSPEGVIELLERPENRLSQKEKWEILAESFVNEAKMLRGRAISSIPAYTLEEREEKQKELRDDAEILERKAEYLFAALGHDKKD